MEEDQLPPEDDHDHSNNSTQQLTDQDIQILQRLDEEYERALEEREVHYAARYHSVRQSAFFSVGFMAIFILLGTVFFLRQTDWGVTDSLLFSIYTITTVGWGHLDTPETPAFQLYVIMFIFVGIATLTIMVAQVYQWIALEASRAQHSRDSHHPKQPTHSIWSSQITANQAATPNTEILWEIPKNTVILERLWNYLDRIRHFLRENEYGRSISVVLPFTGLILIGAAVIGPLEGWGPIESLYFAVVSLTTVGYGDYYPTQTASVWFTILWLPFSIGFMSLFLANVAAFYIRLSDQNIARIERHLRRRVILAKEKAAREREAARERAMRGQQIASSVESDENGENDAEQVESGEDEDAEGVVASSPRRPGNKINRIRGFDTLPETESNQARDLFGSQSFENGPSRREKVLLNSQRVESTTTGSDDEGNSAATPQRSIGTMKELVTRVRENLKKKRSFNKHAEYLNVRSNDIMYQQSRAVRKPSFGLRALVQERFAEIIATDLAGYQSEIEIQDTTLRMSMDVLTEVSEKWKVPRRARRAFRSVAFESLVFVGEHGLITRGADALLELTPFEFHGLFAPLLAALGDAETMEHWMGETEVLAEVDLKRDGSSRGESSARRVLTVMGADEEEDELL